MALRPSTWGLVDGASPGGHDRAAVRLRLDGVESWLDPTCPVCAPGELAPDLWGAQALADGIDRSPPPPAATIGGSLSEDGVLDLILNPPAALVLRLALLDSPPDERGARLPALMGLPGATLLEQEGLGSPGQPVRLRLRVDPEAGPLTWTAGQALGSAGLLRGPGGTWLPLLGEITLSRPMPGAADARSESVALPGLRWFGRVELEGPEAPRLVERLLLQESRLAPGQADRFAGDLDAAWARLTAAPPPPEPELP